MMRIIKIVGLYSLLLGACTPFFLNASETEIMSLEAFKNYLTNKCSNPKDIEDKYNQLNTESKNNSAYKDAALDRLRCWITWADPMKNFGGCTRQYLETLLKKYLLNNKNQAKNIKHVLFRHACFYPTDEEIREITTNAYPNSFEMSDLTYNFLEVSNEWTKFYKKHPKFYPKKERKYIDTKPRETVLKQLNVSTTEVVDIDEKTKQISKKATNYFKPIVITLSLIALGAVGFWSFKKFCPNKFSTLNAKIYALFPRLWNRQKYQPQGLYKFSM